MTAITVWERGHPTSVNLDRLLWSIGGAVFYLAPIALFVVGHRQWYPGPRTVWWRLRHPHAREMHEHRERAWREWPRVGLRMVCWFFGAVATALALAFLGAL